MVSLVLRKGLPIPPTDPLPERTVHVYGGHCNPRCITCDRTPMQAQGAPFAACVRPGLLPFDFVRGHAS